MRGKVQGVCEGVLTRSSPRLSILTTGMMGKAMGGKTNMKAHCRLCEIDLQIGDKIVSKKASNTTTWYHESCAERVNII